MKKLTIEICMDNAAFEDDAHDEVKDILGKMLRDYSISELTADGGDIELYDLNGNNCGRAYVEIGE